ncbi:VOC family protein [Pseudonocardia sp. C8]|uniref:VOC family protein n=1 Tax=Pseudonocardia sp. C8 TaxID=2762759 RepID=UPI001642F396|nr:VOC family protein [Pseudonocardia sp. C8]MBC3191476.1 VOC family protein [Pseudonocardia sp. C8]
MTPTVQIAFDAADPHALARFWAAALGYEVEDHTALIENLLAAGHLTADEVLSDGDRKSFRDVTTCRGPGPRVFVQRVPEPKTAKNRVHLDLQVGPEAAQAEVDRLVGLGAEVLWTTSDRGPVTVTLRDPEGNEFCVS